MSVVGHTPPRVSALWRWLMERVWMVERAFERARAAERVEDDSRIRIFFILAMFGAGFLALSVAAAHSALFPPKEGRAYAWAAEGARADLTDRNGQLLAADLTYYKLFIDPVDVWDKAETRRMLAPYLTGAAQKRLAKILRGDRREFLIGSLSAGEKQRLHDLALPGLTFEEQQERRYPLGSTAAHLIGFTSKGEAGRKGLAGAEWALDQDIQTAAEKHGQVPLSIDLRVQGALEDELQKAAQDFQVRGAVGIVTNVRTGEILGMASYPTFDLNAPGKADANSKIDRAAASVFEMGSTFKAFTVAIGLDTGVATPSSTFDARAPFHIGYRTIHDYHSTGRILSLVDVFIHSSNIGTAKLAVGVGAPTLERYFKALGLTRAANVELKETTRPLTPKVWNEDAVASTSFGHGMNVTPLTLTQAYGAVLNGGKLLPLTIRKLPDGARPDGPQVLSEATSRTMLQIMRANVARGTGGKANAPGLRVGGKTGTGEKYDPEIRRYSGTKQVSSFAAAFPTDGGFDQDRYFVLILMDEPKGNAETYGFSTGGWVAAPAAGRVIDRIAPFLNVQRKDEVLTAIESGGANDVGGGL